MNQIHTNVTNLLKTDDLRALAFLDEGVCQIDSTVSQSLYRLQTKHQELEDIYGLALLVLTPCSLEHWAYNTY